MEPKPTYSSMKDFGPEAELLCHCARKEIELERGKRIVALLEQDLNWAKLLEMAARHHILPLLYSNLTQITPNHVPKGALNLLRDHYFANVVRNGYKAKELLKLLKVFQAHNIPALPYKGVTLSIILYGDPLLRYYNDLDLLIFRKDLSQVEELLSCQGYQLQWTNGKKNAALKHHFHLPFMNIDSKVNVEIHWAFTYPFWSFPIDIEQLWQRIQPVTLGGESVPSFHREDLLLLLCVHGSKDDWCRLKWISDIAELLRLNQGVNWQAIFEQARKLRSMRILSLGLFLAKDLLDGPLPEEVWRKVCADQVVIELGNQRRKYLFTEQPLKGEYRKRSSYYSKLREKSRDKIPVFFHFLILDWLSAISPFLSAIRPNAKDRAMVILPHSLSFLYYLVRVFRLVREKWWYKLKQS
ncbi:MAG: nucleotidyltransferase family protein [Nitrospirae bacterium]|nr:nucleotidyltransferase family protein [Nitrospirota bacterium]